MALPAAGYIKAPYAAPSADISGYVAFVELPANASFWSDVNSSDGSRGRAALDSGPTELASDWIAFDDGGESGYVACYIGDAYAAASEAARTVRLYSPNTRNVAYSPSDTYGSDNAYASDDEGYYPIYGDSGSPVTDRTSNGEDISWSDADITVSSDVLEFTNGHSGVDLMSGKPLDGASGFTVTGFFRPDSITLDGGIFYTDTHGANEPILFWFDNAATDHVAALITTGDGTTGSLYAGATADLSEHYLSLVYDGSNVRLYIDGSEDTSGDFPDALTGTIEASGQGDYIMGNDAGFNKDYDGGMRHMRIKSAGVSAAWIAEEYAQLNDNATFWGTWSWVAAGGGDVFIEGLHEIEDGIGGVTAAGMGGVLQCG